MFITKQRADGEKIPNLRKTEKKKTKLILLTLKAKARRLNMSICMFLVFFLTVKTYHPGCVFYFSLIN